MTKEERKQLILAIWDKLGTVIGWTETGWQKTITKEDCAEEILSIPLDVPTDEEIKESCPQELSIRVSCWIQGARWAIKEIERRN